MTGSNPVVAVHLIYTPSDGSTRDTAIAEAGAVCAPLPGRVIVGSIEHRNGEMIALVGRHGQPRECMIMFGVDDTGNWMFANTGDGGADSCVPVHRATMLSLVLEALQRYDVGRYALTDLETGEVIT